VGSSSRQWLLKQTLSRKSNGQLLNRSPSLPRRFIRRSPEGVGGSLGEGGSIRQQNTPILALQFGMQMT